MIEREKNISKWDYRFYHLYADRKRIKEIDHRSPRINDKSKLIVGMGKSDISFSAGDYIVFVPRKQLEQILADKNSAKIPVYECPKCDFIGWTQEQAKQHHEETGH